MDNYADLLFVDKVRELQDQSGTGPEYEMFYTSRTKETLDEVEIQFLSERESFYISSISSTGWPYVQHRGGPKGFLKVIGENRLGFADYPGNKQFITMGHASQNDKVALFFMDYEKRARLKMLGHLTMKNVEDEDFEICKLLETPGQAKAERIAIIDIVAIDWNCPKYIPELINLEKVKAFTHSKLSALASENKRLKDELEKLKV